MRELLVRLGSTNPELRPHIRPVLAELDKEAAAADRDSVEGAITAVLVAAAKAAAAVLARAYSGGQRWAAGEGDTPRSATLQWMEGGQHNEVQIYLNKKGQITAYWAPSSGYTRPLNATYSAKLGAKALGKQIAQDVLDHVR